MQKDDTARPVEVLSVLGAADEQSLRTIVEHTNWSLANYNRLTEARAAIRASEPAVVICSDRIETFHSWKDVLPILSANGNAPQLIVSSAFADESMWAEILNHGAFDLLQTPFESQEVIYSVSAACRHRNALQRGPVRLPSPCLPSPSTRVLLGCESLDEQHQIEYCLADQLRKALLSGSSNGLCVQELVDRLIEFSVVHFTSEETLMARQEYPHLESHRAEHDSARTRLATLDVRFRDGDRRAAFEIMEFIDNFAQEHIPNADRDLALHLKNVHATSTPKRTIDRAGKNVSGFHTAAGM